MYRDGAIIGYVQLKKRAFVYVEFKFNPVRGIEASTLSELLKKVRAHEEAVQECANARQRSRSS